jgi:hypothetical protein
VNYLTKPEAFSKSVNPLTSKIIDADELKRIDQLAEKDKTTDKSGAANKFLNLFTKEALESVRTGEKKLVSVPLFIGDGREIKLPLSETEVKEMTSSAQDINNYSKMKDEDLDDQQRRDYIESQLYVLNKIKELTVTTYRQKGGTESITKKEEREIENKISLLKGELQVFKMPGNTATMPTSERTIGDIEDADLGRASASLERTLGSEPLSSGSAPDVPGVSGLITDVASVAASVDTVPPTMMEENVSDVSVAAPETNLFSSTVNNGKSEVKSWDSTNARDTLGTFMMCTRKNFAPL